MTAAPNGLLRSVRRWMERRNSQSEPGFGQYLAQIGVLGWTIVVPTLLGVFLGRWIDRSLGTGIFWTGPLMVLGLAAGCRTAWQWMHKR